MEQYNKEGEDAGFGQKKGFRGGFADRRGGFMDRRGGYGKSLFNSFRNLETCFVYLFIFYFYLFIYLFIYLLVYQFIHFYFLDICSITI